MEELLCFSTILKSIDTAPQEIIDDIRKQVPELLKQTGIKLDSISIVKPEDINNAHGQAQGLYIGYDNFKTRILISETSTRNNNNPHHSEAHYKFLDYTFRLEEAKNHWDRAEREKCEELQRHAAFYKWQMEYTTFHYDDINRNSTIDHEFGHCLCFNRLNDNRKYWSLFFGKLGTRCRDFCEKNKIMGYGVATDTSESLVEVYSYWKAGNPVPMEIEYGFRRIEEGKIEFCSEDHCKDIYL